MTEREIKTKVLDLYNALVSAEAWGLTFRLGDDVKMEVTLSKDVKLPTATSDMSGNEG